MLCTSCDKELVLNMRLTSSLGSAGSLDTTGGTVVRGTENIIRSGTSNDRIEIEIRGINSDSKNAIR